MKKEQFNRRNFLKLSSTGLLGGILYKKAGFDTDKNYNDPDNERQDFIYRELGNTGIKLPIVSLGAMKVDNANLIKAALNKGIAHIDTAQVYQKGRNEEMLGKILKDYDRASYVIATKVKPPGWNWESKSLDAKKATKEAFLNDFKVSLERLQLEFVDIVYVHAIHKKEVVLHQPFIEALKQLKKEGKIRLAGISTHQNEPEVLRAAVESNFYDVVLTAYNFKKSQETDIDNAIEEAANAGIGIVGMKTMAGGYLDKEKTKKINTKAALKWVLQNKNIHTTIPGCTSFDQLESNIACMKDLSLTPQERDDLELDKTAGLYCTGCEECTFECEKELNIPDAMRAYMYAYGYNDLGLAHNTLNECGLPADACEDCDFCTVQCRSGFNVAERIKDVKRVMDIPDDFIT